MNIPAWIGVLLTLWLAAPVWSAPVPRGEMFGYLLFDGERVPKEFNGGFSLYAAAWPLVDHYPGHDFQTGLLSTWMHPLWEANQKPKEECYIDIEGGLGWWRDTHFPTPTPKFIMGGVGPNFSVIANGPGYGAGTWEDERGLYGVAQLSPWLLFPLDGLNLRQGVQGDWFGYGYLPLPLTDPKPTTAGRPVPTGNQCWTLFLNTANFKGPAAFFTPFFWSRALLKDPQWAGRLLDSAPSDPNKAIQMETQHIPAVFGTNHDGTVHARMARTSFPVTPDGHSALLHRHTVYTKAALWEAVERWFAGGPASDGLVKPSASATQRFKATGGSSWSFFPPDVARERAASVAWKSFATPITPDPSTLGFRWDGQLTRRSGSLVTLPEFFRLGSDRGKPRWNVVPSSEVPGNLGLTQFRFETPREDPQEPRTTPDAPDSSWRKPGPVAGPFKVRLGDGSVVTYHWYRFADQPAMLNADLTAAEREVVQKRVELLHRTWTKDREYLAPPDHGRLAAIDPALIVTPPKGLEIGYVPIATRQELE